MEQLEHALRGARIEIAGRLVCQQQRWTGHQRTGNGDPLLLATRDLRGFLVGERAEADLLEQGARQSVSAREGLPWRIISGISTFSSTLNAEIR